MKVSALRVMTSLARLDASAIAAAVGSGRTSAESVIDDVLARLAIYDAVQPQAWISRFDDEALRAAWSDPKATVASAVAPTYAERIRASGEFFRDPAREARRRRRPGDQGLNSSAMLSMPAWMASNESLRARILQA
jgi:hypothetical protein